jgi:hypothetical protein
VKFHLDLKIHPQKKQISYTEKILLIGSCFAENIGMKLHESKFDIFINPHGILYNPASIAKSLETYIDETKYSEKDLFYHHELWNSWDHHGKFSSVSKTETLSRINDSQLKAINFAKNADWLIITLGSSYVYTLLKNKHIVGNCHKVPGTEFDKIFLTSEESFNLLEGSFLRLRQINPKIKIILTVSPVRYIREGVIENNKSKAALITAVNQLSEKLHDVFYFPAYELVIDDLRDYRFYTEDLVHPNSTAIEYVWEKFSDSIIDKGSHELMDRVLSLVRAAQHRPMNPNTKEHKEFLEKNHALVQELSLKFPFLNLEREREYFSEKNN